MFPSSKVHLADSPWLPLLVALVINGIALLLSDNYIDGDAHTRTFMAIEWLRDPFLIVAPNETTWVFGPLHCYLNAAILSLWYDPPLAPRVLSWLLSSLTILPFYYSVRMTFTKRIAFYSSLLFCFYTLFVHAAAVAVSEGINLFFVFLAVWLYLRFRLTASWRELLLCATALLLATMMRYDSWPLANLLPVYLLVSYLHNRRTESHNRVNLSQVIVFGVLANGFAILWLLASWIKLGDPLTFMHYSGNLDAPFVARRIAEMGTLKYLGYNTAFLPGVLFLSLPATSFVLALIGFWKTIRTDFTNLLLLALGVFVAFYLVTFVISFERVPLARFTIIPGAFLLCFAGAGLVWLEEKLSARTGALLRGVAIAGPAIMLAGLGWFSQPSAVDWKEKLRAISPITRPPEYFRETADILNERLTSGASLVLDCRNYNDRLLYLDLWRHHARVRGSWPDTDSLENFIRIRRPEFVLDTSFPKRDHELFNDADGDSGTSIAEIPYRRLNRAGIFTIFQLRK